MPKVADHVADDGGTILDMSEDSADMERIMSMGGRIPPERRAAGAPAVDTDEELAARAFAARPASPPRQREVEPFAPTLEVMLVGRLMSVGERSTFELYCDTLRPLVRAYVDAPTEGNAAALLRGVASLARRQEPAPTMDPAATLKARQHQRDSWALSLIRDHSLSLKAAEEEANERAASWWGEDWRSE